MKKTFKTFALMLLTALAFSSCADVPVPFNLPDKGGNSGGDSGTTIDPAGEGTLDSPYNVAAIVAIVNEMEAGVESTEEYYVKGKVLAVKTDQATINQYGNHTFTMVDEGSTSPVFTAFQVYGPGKKKFTSVDDIKVGDEVIVCGKVVNYRGNTPETVGKGASYVVSINSEGGGDNPPVEGTEVTCAEAVELTNALENGATSTETYTVTGYITEVVGNVSNSKDGIPQQTFWMADTKDGGKVFEAYYANVPSGVSAFTVGMKVKLTGQLMKYVNKTSGQVTPEIKNGNVVVLEDGGGDTPPAGDAVQVSCAEAVQLTQELADGGTSTDIYAVTGYITETDGNVSTKTGPRQQVFWMADTKDGGKVFEAYWANVPDGVEKFTVGMKVTITGKLKKYVKSGQVTCEIQNPDVVILEQGDGDGGDTPGPGGDEVTDLVNGNFEEWVSDSEPLGWKSASTASNATLSKSTEAHGGSYACLVAAPGDANKRLATQEMTLEAGTYTFSFYAKSTTANVCQSRAGYVPMKEDGTVGSYKYGDYTNINNNEWTLVSYEFTLTATTKLCLLVMNPKNSSYSTSQDILVDDATLVKQ
ncbi:MAG: carbohydrate binding domain-containing protein [Bacteroidaceae bacterium]|nr:carbohydrate binding domain-containing protein [Bacteroidaceae bacterium]